MSSDSMIKDIFRNSLGNFIRLKYGRKANVYVQKYCEQIVDEIIDNVLKGKIAQLYVVDRRNKTINDIPFTVDGIIKLPKSYGFYKALDIINDFLEQNGFKVIVSINNRSLQQLSLMLVVYIDAVNIYGYEPVLAMVSYKLYPLYDMIYHMKGSRYASMTLREILSKKFTSNEINSIMSYIRVVKK